MDEAALAEARRLLPEGRALEQRLWETRRRLLRSIGFPILPSELVKEISTWNKQVLALADKCLSAREAGDVRTLPAQMTPVADAKTIGEILQDNQQVLLRLIQAGERQNPIGHPDEDSLLLGELDVAIQYMQGLLKSDHATATLAEELAEAYVKARQVTLTTHPRFVGRLKPLDPPLSGEHRDALRADAERYIGLLDWARSELRKEVGS